MYCICGENMVYQSVRVRCAGICITIEWGQDKDMKEFTVTDKNGEKRVETLLMSSEEFRALAERENLPYSSALLGSLSPIRYCKIEKYPTCLLGTMRVPPIEGRAAFAFGFYLQETRCYLFPEDCRQEAQTEAVSEADCAAMLDAGAVLIALV